MLVFEIERLRFKGTRGCSGLLKKLSLFDPDGGSFIIYTV